MKNCFILVLFLFSIEYLGWNGLTVYRLGILPLCLLGYIYARQTSLQKNYKTYVAFTIIYMLYFSGCLLVTDDNFLFPILTIPLAMFVYAFLAQKNKIIIDYAKIFLWYSLPHLIVLPLGLANWDGSRYAGLHDDPNFCGIFICFSIIAATQILTHNHYSKKWKIISILFLAVDLVLLFLTGSRGAMLSLSIIAILMFSDIKIKRIWKIIIVITLAVFIWKLYNYILTLDDWVSPDTSLIDSVLCRFKPDNLASGSDRSDIWETVWQRLIDSNPLVPIGMVKAMKGLANGYPHNTFLDILVDNGFLFGLIVIIVLFYFTIKSFLNVRKKKYDNNDMVYIWCCYSVMLQLAFLSAIQQKFFWICIFYLIYMANNRFGLRQKAI